MSLRDAGGAATPGTSAVRLRTAPTARCGQVSRCCWIQLKMLAVDPVTVLLQVLWPLFFSTTVFLIFRGDPDGLVYAALGAAAMGIWSEVTSEASNALQRERYYGTLELLVTTPMPFALVVLTITTAMTATGTYSALATLLWGEVVFGISIPMDNPLLFALSLGATILSVAMLGFLLAVTVVRFRSARALGSLLEYPGWLLCGLLVPVSLLPPWVGWIGNAVPTTWGMRAMRSSATGGSPWTDLGLCLGLGLAYIAVAAMLSGAVLRSARRHAALSLS